MNINGTMVNYYFHCKRQCYLFANRINLEDNSEDVRIGRIIHEIKAETENNSEIKIENISVDKITSKYVIELKKSDADINAAKMQVLFYLDKLRSKGIIREGKLKFSEKNTNEISEIISLSDENQKKLEECKKSIYELITSDIAPEPSKIKGCKKCAYYEYCYI